MYAFNPQFGTVPVTRSRCSEHRSKKNLMHPHHPSYSIRERTLPRATTMADEKNAQNNEIVCPSSFRAERFPTPSQQDQQTLSIPCGFVRYSYSAPRIMRFLASGIWALLAGSCSSASLSSAQHQPSSSSSAHAVESALLPQDPQLLRLMLRQKDVVSQPGNRSADPGTSHQPQFSVLHENNAIPTIVRASEHQQHDEQPRQRVQQHHHHNSDNNNDNNDNNNNNSSTPDEPLLFCDNSMPMTMFMDGFRSSLFTLETIENEKKVEAEHVKDNTHTSSTPPPPCLQYLWGQWNLTSRSRFGWAFVASFGLSMALEALSALRCFLPAFLLRGERLHTSPASASAQSNSPHRRHPCFVAVRVTATFHYALQALLGYLIMLVVMSYSPELLFGVILGLMVGHATFATNSVGTAPPPTTTTHVSATATRGGPRQHEHPNYCHSHDNDNDNDLSSQDDFAALCQPLLVNEANSSYSSPPGSSYVV